MVTCTHVLPGRCRPHTRATSPAALTDNVCLQTCVRVWEGSDLSVLFSQWVSRYVAETQEGSLRGTSWPLVQTLALGEPE